MHGKQLLDNLEKIGAFVRDKHFLLVSGYHSDVYVNVRVALSFQNIASKIGEELANEFQRDEVDAVVGFTRSGNTLAQIVAESLKVKAINIYIIDGDLVFITNNVIMKGDNLLIVDDVLTTGKSILKALRIIRKKTKGKVVGIGVVVDRSKKRLNFGVGIKFRKLAKIDMNLWSQDTCPRCHEGEEPTDLSKPSTP
jgi:orotate phosphoribosyltransferase